MGSEWASEPNEWTWKKIKIKEEARRNARPRDHRSRPSSGVTSWEKGEEERTGGEFVGLLLKSSDAAELEWEGVRGEMPMYG